MAAALKQLQSQASTYSKLLSTHGTKAYQQLLERNKQYIVDGGSPAAVEELGKKFVFTSLASVPKSYGSAMKEWEFVKSKWAQRADLPLAEIGIATVFVAELYAWFTVGEIVGRGFTFTGYKV